MPNANVMLAMQRSLSRQVMLQSAITHVCSPSPDSRFGSSSYPAKLEVLVAVKGPGPAFPRPLPSPRDSSVRGGRHSPLAPLCLAAGLRGPAPVILLLLLRRRRRCCCRCAQPRRLATGAPRPPQHGRAALPAATHEHREAVGLEQHDEAHERHAHEHHGDGEAPVGRGNGKLGDAKHGRDKGEGQEDHGDHGQDLNVVALVDGAARLLDGGAAEELVAQVFDFLARALVALDYGRNVGHGLFELGAQRAHGLPVVSGGGGGGGGVVRGVFGGERGVRPEQRVRAGPELRGKGVCVGGDHGGEAGVDDGEGVVGPKVAANVGKVLVLKEELVAQAMVKYELRLAIVSRHAQFVTRLFGGGGLKDSQEE